MLGGALAGALIDSGHHVVALVRGAGRRVLDMDGRDRAGEVDQVHGDIALAGFGLSGDPGPIDCLLHCAATTDFSADDAEYGAINVGGARHAGDLAMQWDVPLVHISTAYVCGARDGAIGEVPPQVDGAFTNGYEASKAHAEVQLLGMQANGLRLTIARPSIILGRLTDGAIARQDDFYHLFRLFGSPLLGPVPAQPNAAFALVPIDHVVSGVLAMVEQFDCFAGRMIHLVAAKAFPMADMLEIVGDYPKTVPATMVPPQLFTPEMLDRRQTMIHRRIGTQFFDYFLRAPEFEAVGLAQMAGIPAPHIDQSAFRRMIDYCVKTGFLDWK